MICVVFEVWLDSAHREGYLNWAAGLKTELRKDGRFISIERFQSLSDPDKLLSLQFWRDDNCLTAWRNPDAHRDAQNVGRSTMFKDHRLRVAKVTRGCGLEEQDEAPTDSRQAHG